MTSITPMFPGWSRKLHGRRPVRPALLMRRKARSLSSLCIRQAQDLFGELLPLDLLTGVAGRRERAFPLPVIFWCFLCQVLSNGSCRNGVASVQVLLSRHGKAICSPGTAAYCKARARIPIRLLLKMNRRLTGLLCPRSGPRTFVIDGTTLGMPDTAANQERWPQSRSQKPGCGFPIIRVVGLFDLASGVWVAMAKGNYRSNERNLCRRLWRHLRAGDTLVTDAGFCSWFTLFLLNERGIHVVMRRNGVRKLDPRPKRLGKGDRLERWKKPFKPAWLDQASFDRMPLSMAVRVVRVVVDPAAGHRAKELYLTSTVPDPSCLSAVAITALYLRRWQVELFLDDLKTTLGMAVLGTRSPAMIHREILVHVLAYNLLRALIGHRGAKVPGTASFKGTLDRLNHWMPALLSAIPARVRRRLVIDLLELIAEDQVPERPGRRELRTVKRRPKPFQLMTRPRGEMVEISHRSRYKKPLS